MKWYYLFSRDYAMVVLDYYQASDAEYFEKAEKFLKQHSLPVEDFDVMGPFVSRKEAVEDALEWGKANFQKLAKAVEAAQPVERIQQKEKSAPRMKP